MEIIIISSEIEIQKETQIINNLFGLGMKKFHLRKPLFSESQQFAFLSNIDEKFMHCIHIHQHYHHAKIFKLGGIHIKSTSNIIEHNTCVAVSRSCHSFTQLELIHSNYDYLFLSPIFNSISKHKYYSAFSIASLKVFFANKNVNNCYALGGIDLNNAKLLKGIGFKGIVLLGYMWTHNSENEIYKAFINISSI